MDNPKNKKAEKILKEMCEHYGEDLVKEAGHDLSIEFGLEDLDAPFSSAGKIMFEWNNLDRKTKEFIIIACNICQMYSVGINAHVRGAIKAGATRGELVEVIGIAGLIAGTPNLLTALKACAPELRTLKK